MSMTEEVKNVQAAGLIIFRKFQNQIQYLLLQHSDHHWNPPKGHVEPGESKFETALRETEEESGLTSENLSIIKQFQKEIFYRVKNKNKNKHVMYWLSELKDINTPVKLSHEHINYKWVSLEEAISILTYNSMHVLLEDVAMFLKENPNPVKGEK